MSSRPNAHNRPVLKLSQRIAEEAQLLAEEKWIIEALKKMKAQRNALQIERLHLESMRAKILSNASKSQTESVNASKTVTAAATSVPVPTEFVQPSHPVAQVKPRDMDDNEICNMEELNLSVTNSVFNVAPFGSVCDEEEDDEDMENCVVDIDLLMSSK